MSADPKKEEIELEVIEDGEDTEIVDGPGPDPEADEGDPEHKPETKADPVPAEEGGEEGEDDLDGLKTQLANANKAREAAEKRAKDLEDTTAKTRNASDFEKLDLYERSIDSAITENETKLAQIKKDLIEAKDAGESEKEVDLLDEMHQTRNKLNYAKSAKDEAGKIRKKLESGEIVHTQKPAAQDDEYTPEARAWIEKNPLFNTDEKFNKIATAGHYLAEAQGLKANSPEYFTFIEKELDEKYHGKKADPKPAPKTANKKQATAAPASGGGTGGGGGPNGGKIQLTKTQHREFTEAAEMNDMTLPEYLKLPEVAAKLKAQQK